MRSSLEALEQPGAEAGLVPTRVAQPSSTEFGQVFSILWATSVLLRIDSLELAAKAGCWPRCTQVALEGEGEIGTQTFPYGA